MNISLPSGLEHFVREQVDSGLYDSCNEVHRDGLRLLKAQKDRDQEKLAALREFVAVGVRQADNGELVPFDVDAIVARGKERQRERLD